MKRVVYYTLSLMFILLSCTKEDEVLKKQKKETKREELKNPNAAKNNDEIIYQNNSNEAAAGSYWKSIAVNNEVFLTGKTKGSYSFIKEKSYNQTLAQSPNDLKYNALKKVFLIVGSNQSKGQITVHNTNGSQVSSFLFKEDEYKETNLYNIQHIATNGTDDYYLIVGYVENYTKTSYPFIGCVKLDKDNKISKAKGGFKVLKLKGERILAVKMKDKRIYFTTNFRDAQGNITKAKLHAYTPLINTINNSFWADSMVEFNKTWEQSISSSTNSNLFNQSRTGNFHLYNNSLIVVGQTYDTKNPAPSGGGFWDSGLVTTYNLDGNKLWQTKVNSSNKDDRFYGSLIKDNELHLVGSHSGLYYESQKKEFSNGLYVKMNLSNGNIIFTKTFGNEKEDSNFNTIQVLNKVHLYGYRSGKQWKVEINK